MHPHVFKCILLWLPKISDIWEKYKEMVIPEWKVQGSPSAVAVFDVLNLVTVVLIYTHHAATLQSYQMPVKI